MNGKKAGKLSERESGIFINEELFRRESQRERESWSERETGDPVNYYYYYYLVVFTIVPVKQIC